ncbi:uncharacterized protein LOC105700642 isoform X2 [Orussus abietinus]|uniref:uncharacterized protein LOC105700642 isoform X2 n=1 Tax=Orussus abietinus TaxID=222816 RepID=UPI0006253BC2|nr:uncharacterized protein LOC105700642 isoform X2 [Orussus abietinus]
MKVAALVLGFFATSTISRSVRAEPYAEDTLVKALFKVKKRHEDWSYLEQCGVVKFWRNEQPGVVSVLAFLDASWKFSHGQATMLRLLRDRFERSGLYDVRFFVVNAISSTSSPEDEEEREVWEEVSPFEDDFQLRENSVEALMKEAGPDILMIQDTEDLRIWEELHASKDQIAVVDRCGRLTYQVIVPWSILHFPYVKAAILSTYEDDPCGTCNRTSESPTVEPIDQQSPDNLRLENEEHNFLDDGNYHTTSFSYKLSENLADTTVTTSEDATKNSEVELSTTKGGKDPEVTTPSFNIAGDSDEKLVQEKNEGERINDLSTENNVNEETTRSYFSSEFESEDVTDFRTEDLTEVDTPSTRNSEIGDPLTENTAIEVDFQTEEPRMTVDTSTEIDNFEVEPITTDTSLEMNFEETSTDQDALLEDVEEVKENFVEVPSLLSSLEESREEEQINSEEHDTKHVVDDFSDPDDVMPIRIIMHAPHLHERNHAIKKHEYLVLKTGVPDYHEHLDPGEEIELSHRIPGFKKLDKLSMKELAADLGSEEVNEEGKKGTRRKNGVLLDIFGNDESPGFYGEDADYWRNHGNVEYHEGIQTLRPDINQAYNDEDSPTRAPDLIEDVLNGKSNFVDMKKPIYGLNDNDQTREESVQMFGTEEAIGGEDDEDIDPGEEEIKSRLIAHYSKLLPWIYYVLD